MGLSGPGQKAGVSWLRERGRASWAGLLGSSGQRTPTQDVAVLPCPCHSHANPRIAALLTLLPGQQLPGSAGTGGPHDPIPISTIQPKANFGRSAGRGWAGEVGQALPAPDAPHPCMPSPGLLPSSQGPGSWWPWPPRVATCRSRAIGLRPPLCSGSSGLSHDRQHLPKAAESQRDPTEHLSCTASPGSGCPSMLGILPSRPCPQGWNLLGSAAAVRRRHRTPGQLPAPR